MTSDRHREPYVAASADTPDQVRKKGTAGKAVILFIACFAALMFLLYLSIVLYAGYKAS